MRSRLPLLLQVPASLAIIAWLPGNGAKLAALLVLWWITFRPVRRADALLYLGACFFFTLMNAVSLQQGIFRFSSPDVLGMPVYEIFMWGFYLLHVKRVLGGEVPHDRRVQVWLLSALYALAFAAIADADRLLQVTAALLLVGVYLFHQRLDLAYLGYMVLLGAAVEYVGVFSGQWSYPGNPAGGVPFWFITLWGGVGLFLRRLVLPLLPVDSP
ncbi:MAG: hypothetical protein WCK83_15570 [Burkholderiales bacterium]